MNTKKNILQRIESGEISMKPKIYFILRAFALAFALIIGTLITLYVFSFIVFILKGTGILSLYEFGGRGLLLLMFSIPWLLVVSVLFLVFVLEVLARHFAFVYRKPLVYSTLAILVLIIFAGTVVASTPIHKKIYERSHTKAVSLTGSVYKHYGKIPPRGGHIGTVIDIDSNGLTLEVFDGNVIKVSTTTRTKYPADTKLEVGAKIMVLGKKGGDSYEAFGIKLFDEDTLPFSMERFKPEAMPKMK